MSPSQWDFPWPTHTKWQHHVQLCADRSLTTSCSWSVEFYACDVNTSTMTSFKLPLWGHWTRAGEGCTRFSRDGASQLQNTIAYISPAFSVPLPYFSFCFLSTYHCLWYYLSTCSLVNIVCPRKLWARWGQRLYFHCHISTIQNSLSTQYYLLEWMNAWMNEMAKDIDNSQKRKHVIIKCMEKCSLPLALIVRIRACYQEREGCCPEGTGQ